MEKNIILKKIYDLKQQYFRQVFVNCKFNQLEYHLMLLTKDCEAKLNIIKLLALWRKKHEQWFPSRFEITLTGTKSWLLNKVIKQPDRLLFMIEVNRQFVGHIGLFRFDFENLSCEIDNIVRGEKIYPGIIENAINHMMGWAKKELKLKFFTLQTSSDNLRALRLYNRLGFKETKRIPLVLISENGENKWIPAAKDFQGQVKRYDVFMQKK